MRLGNARLCLDCEEVHDTERCPVCGSETFAFLKRWVSPAAPPTKQSLLAGQATPASGRPDPVDTYERLLNPGRQRSRKGRLVARGAVGLAVLGAARLAWRVRKTLQDGVSDPGPDTKPSADRN